MKETVKGKREEIAGWKESTYKGERERTGTDVDG